ncbi:MAG: hypothetical protein ACRD0D_08205 [Acidimicrobiales bacterium]
MPDIPLNATEARYLLALLKVHLIAQAPDESELRAEMDEGTRGIKLTRGSTSWYAERDGIAEVTVTDDGRVEARRWRFGFPTKMTFK